MATITTIESGEAWTTSRPKINTNFENLNTDLIAAEWDIDTLQWDITTLNTSKLSVSDYQNGTKVYGASSTGTDAYAVTLSPAPSAYLTGMTFRFQADVANTWPSTLNVNTLWDKTIKKQHDIDLETGDIEAGQIVTVSYDGTNFQMDSQVATLPTVDINWLTEDTTGDMNADFALVYDTSAWANRKQKVNVFRATDAEIDTGTSTTKFITPAQASEYSPSTLTRNDWYTFIAPFGIAWNGSGLSSWTYVNVPTTAQDCAMGMFNAIGTGTSSMLISAKIPWVSYSAPTYTPTSSKDIRIKWRMALEKSSGLPRNAIGMCVTNTDIYAVYTSIANWLIRFVRDWSTLYAHNSNGTTATSTDVSSGVTMTNMNTYEIIFNPWVDAKFYINGTLVATHTTNLPTTWSLLFALWADDDGSTTAMYISPITVSIEL